MPRSWPTLQKRGLPIAQVRLVQLCLSSRRTWLGLWHKNRLFFLLVFFFFPILEQ